MSKLKQIKALLGFTRLLDADLVSRSNAVCNGLTGNPAYPNPPVDMASFKWAIDSYTASIADALDGSKKAIVERNKRREALVKTLQFLGHYVEMHCKDDLGHVLVERHE